MGGCLRHVQLFRAVSTWPCVPACSAHPSSPLAAQPAGLSSPAANICPSEAVIPFHREIGKLFLEKEDMVSLPLRLSFTLGSVLFFFFNLKKNYLFLAALGLRCYARAFSSSGERGLLFHCSAWASHCGGFSCCGARALGHAGFSTCGTGAQ